MDPGLFHGNGLYFCEQNRNNIGQTSNFNIILIDDNIIRNIFRTYSKNSNTPNMFENMLLCIKHYHSENFERKKKKNKLPPRNKIKIMILILKMLRLHQKKPIDFKALKKHLHMFFEVVLNGSNFENEKQHKFAFI